MNAFKKTLVMAACSFALLTSCSAAGGRVTAPPEPTVIVRETAKPCSLPSLPPRPRSLDGELLVDGRVALKPETLTTLNLWLSAAYEYMVAAEACR